MRLNQPLRLVAAAVLAALLSAAPAAAQLPFYPTIVRPHGTGYRVLVTPHFHIIFQEGLEQAAREAAAVLEESLPETRRLLGVYSAVEMPVVLNGFNDRANGYVTPFPFRQEIEAAAIKSNFLTPRYGWIEQVAIHELTHAVHAETKAGFGVGTILRTFAPDYARELNLTVPPGITEGVAVLRESRVHPHAGRLNLSLIEMQYRAAMLSGRPWSLSQVLEAPAYTYPLDRFYNGGAHFAAFLAERDSLRTVRRAQRFYYRFPFLGYGAALWAGAGTPPWSLGKEFRRYAGQQLQEANDSIGPVLPPPLLAGGRGVVFRRPRWVDDRTLVAYGQGYSLTPGFYRFDAETGERKTIGHHEITEDYFYSLSGDSAAVLFSRYVDDPTVLIKSIAEVYRVDLRSGDAQRLTEQGRAFAPVPAPGGGLWALRNDGPFTRWVRLGSDDAEIVAGPRWADIRAVLPAPDGRSAALLINAGGYQGLFRADLTAPEAPRLEPWIIFEDAVVFDASWSRDGRFLLFSADPGGVSNIFGYDLRENRLLRFTNVPFSAFEPSLSPDGARLAFVNYRHERFDLAVIPFEPEQAEEIDLARAAAGREVDWDTILDDEPQIGFEAAASPPYRPWDYVAPRIWYPLVQGDSTPNFDGDLGVRFGAGVQGADPLQRWAYAAELYVQNGRLWGQAGVRTGLSFLQPGVGVYFRPLQSNEGGIKLYEERGVLAEIAAPLRLSSNVYSSTASFGLAARLGEVRRFAAEANEPEEPPSNRLVLTPHAALNLKMQRNVRDLVPNTGLVLLADADVAVWQSRYEPGRAFTGRAFGYLPFLKSMNHGLRLDAGFHTWNGQSTRELFGFVPRGYEDEALGAGPLVRYGVEHVAPFAYPDRGLVILPVYLSALYGYSFAERLHAFRDAAPFEHLTSLGAGLGAHVRLFSLFDLDLRLGVAYRVEEKEWSWTGR